MVFSYNGALGNHNPILPDESPKLDPEDIEHVCKVAKQSNNFSVLEEREPRKVNVNSWSLYKRPGIWYAVRLRPH